MNLDYITEIQNIYLCFEAEHLFSLPQNLPQLKFEAQPLPLLAHSRFGIGRLWVYLCSLLFPFFPLGSVVVPVLAGADLWRIKISDSI